MRCIGVFFALLALAIPARGEEVVTFDPRPATVEQEGNTYVGILVSEEDFRKILQNKVDTTAELGNCAVDRRSCAAEKDIYLQAVKELREAALVNDTWFNRNKGTLGVVTGLLMGAGFSVAIVKAVYQQ